MLLLADGEVEVWEMRWAGGVIEERPECSMRWRTDGRFEAWIDGAVKGRGWWTQRGGDGGERWWRVLSGVMH